MKKTLLFTIDFAPRTGGVARYYKDICSHLLTQEIVVLAEHELETELQFDKGQPYKIYRKDLITKLPIWPKWIFSPFYLHNAVKREKIDFVLVGQILPLGAIVWLYKKIFKVPYGVFIHGMDLGMAKKKKRKYWLALMILKDSSCIIANSNYTRQLILDLGIEKDKVEVIYPGVEVNDILNGASEPSLLKDMKMFLASPQRFMNETSKTDTKVILTVGRLVKRKGHDMVIKALPKVMQKFPDIVYIIVGDGPEKNNLENLIKENNLNNVIFNLADDKIKRLYYEMSDIFIMPSRKISGDVEGFGIVYLEAALYGKPVIAGKNGGAPEAVVDKKTGILVDSKNIDEIADAIIKLLADPDLANKLGVQGRERVLRDFTWKTQIEKIKKLLT